MFFSNLYLYLCSVFKKQCLIKVFKFMEKCYLCAVQSKVNPNQNETILVSVENISEFVSSYIAPDCVIVISNCSTFKAISDEK